MWIIGRHRHIKPERLSESLDGRLPAGAQARIDRAVASCAYCREDLESLQATRSLLREMPPLTLPRSFVLPAAPQTGMPGPDRAAPADVSSTLLGRLPAWGYAGVASLAGLSLALMVLADATGRLAPPAGGATESFLSAPAIERVIEPDIEAIEREAPAEMAAPAAASQVDQVDPLESMPAEAAPAQAMMESQAEVAEVQPADEPPAEMAAAPQADAAPEMAVAAVEGAAPAETTAEPLESLKPFAAEAMAEVAADAGPEGELVRLKEGPVDVPAESDPPDAAPAGATGEQGDAGQGSTPAPTATPGPTVTPTAAPTPTLTPVPTPTPTATLMPVPTPMPPQVAVLTAKETPPAEETGRPAGRSRILWWTLEGLAALLVLAGLVGLVVKLRQNRRI